MAEKSVSKDRKAAARQVQVRREVHLPLHLAVRTQAKDDLSSICSRSTAAAAAASRANRSSSSVAGGGTVSRPYIRHSYSVGSYPYMTPSEVGARDAPPIAAADNGKAVEKLSLDERADGIFRRLMDSDIEWTPVQERQARACDRNRKLLHHSHGEQLLASYVVPGGFASTIAAREYFRDKRGAWFPSPLGVSTKVAPLYETSYERHFGVDGERLADWERSSKAALGSSPFRDRTISMWGSK